MDSKEALIVFEGTKIRRTWHDDQWYFSVVDVVGVLTDSSIPRRYWSDLKIKLEEEGFELYEKIVQLKLPSADGKKYETDCANTESMFRIIQSIPSKKAEPFKRWLAKVGYERIQEIENPELAQDRIKEYYELKGYPKDWIATFGKSISEHRTLKALDPLNKNHNLRDHMTDLELIFTMLGEKSTTEITKSRDSRGFGECLDSSKEGGKIAGNARKELEKKTGRKVVSSENYLNITGKKENKKLE